MVKKKIVTKEVRDIMYSSIVDCFTLKVTVPLSNATKQLHTHSFVYIPYHTFFNTNLDKIFTYLGRNYGNSPVNYRKNHWYVKKIIIKDEETAELELTALPGHYDFDANSLKKNTNSTGQKTAQKTSKTKNKSAQDDTFLKNLPELSKSENEFLHTIIKKAIGTKRDKVKMGKAIHEYYKKHHVFSYYSCMRTPQNSFRKKWYKREQNCGDGASTLAYMFEAAGFNPDLMHGDNHFFIRVKIDGVYYYCDNGGCSGCHNWRKFGKSRGNSTVWGGAYGYPESAGYKYHC